MKEKIVEYGTRVDVKVIQSSRSLITVYGGDPTEGYFLVGHGMAELPKEGDFGHIIFQRGGSKKGYWQYYPNPKIIAPMPTQIDDCSRHKKEVAGITDMKQLAEMIGDLHYETMAQFALGLAVKLNHQSRQDIENGKEKWANALLNASRNMLEVYIDIEDAWQISKPFMEDKTKES